MKTSKMLAIIGAAGGLSLSAMMLLGILFTCPRVVLWGILHVALLTLVGAGIGCSFGLRSELRPLVFGLCLLPVVVLNSCSLMLGVLYVGPTLTVLYALGLTALAASSSDLPDRVPAEQAWPRIRESAAIALVCAGSVLSTYYYLFEVATAAIVVVFGWVFVPPAFCAVLLIPLNDTISSLHD